LAGLSVDNLGGVPNLLVDELLVAGIDQRRNVDDGDGDERKTPERKKFDEPVGNQRGSESLSSVSIQVSKMIELDLQHRCASDSLRIKSAETQLQRS